MATIEKRFRMGTSRLQSEKATALGRLDGRFSGRKADNR
jgi:hypothetical protein